MSARAGQAPQGLGAERQRAPPSVWVSAVAACRARLVRVRACEVSTLVCVPPMHPCVWSVRAHMHVRTCESKKAHITLSVPRGRVWPVSVPRPRVYGAPLSSQLSVSLGTPL